MIKQREQQNAQPQFPPSVIRLAQRLHNLERGKGHLLLVKVPEQKDKPTTWTFLGSGKEENADG